MFKKMKVKKMHESYEYSHTQLDRISKLPMQEVNRHHEVGWHHPCTSSILMNVNWSLQHYELVCNQIFRKQLEHFFFLIFNYYLCWNLTTGSAQTSLTSTVFPFSITSFCFRAMSQPICAKKKPLLTLCGSALVSANLWCTRWSLAHS